jgi:hypothetical protein
VASSTVTVIRRGGVITADTTTITMHAVVTEQHQLTNTITDHPVETGFNASDHSRPNPDLLTLDCRISNTPLSNTQATEAVKAGAFTIQTTTAAAQAAGAIGAVDGYAQGEWAKLRRLRDTSAIVTVSTTMGDYDSMAIESISLPRAAKNYDAIAFSISFKHIRVVQNKLTRGVVSSDKRVGKKKSTGTKTAKDANKDVDPMRTLADTAAQSDNPTVSGIGKALGGK